MTKERLAAFTDAILAIIMTILVLELKKPNPISWENLWQLRMNFFAYTISFFWLGAMWVLLHRNWYDIKSISNKTVWQSLLMLFFSSFFLMPLIWLQVISIIQLLSPFMVLL